MLKAAQYLSIFLVFVVLTGCETIKGTTVGAATGLSQDIQNTADPDKNGWNELRKADVWMRQNLW